mgnify:CR=1 FL=1
MADLTLATSAHEAIPDLPPVARANRAMLALDLGTATGWALRTADGLITSGTLSLRPSRYDGGGMRYLRFSTGCPVPSQPSGSRRCAATLVPTQPTSMAVSWRH